MWCVHKSKNPLHVLFTSSLEANFLQPLGLLGRTGLRSEWRDLQDETDLATDNHDPANLPRGRGPEAKEDAVFVW